MPNAFQVAWHKTGLNLFAKVYHAYRTPVYLLLGQKGIGKSSLLNAIRGPVIAEAEDRYARVLVTKACILIEVANIDSHWLKQVSGMRLYKPFDAILILSNIKLNFSGLRSQLDLIGAIQKTHTPVYCLINRVDQLHGFEDFFDHAQQLCSQSWSLKTSLKKLDFKWQKGVCNIAKRTTHHVNYLNSPISNINCYGFMQALTLLRRPLINNLTYLFSAGFNRGVFELKGLFLIGRRHDNFLFYRNIIPTILTEPKPDNLLLSHLNLLGVSLMFLLTVVSLIWGAVQFELAEQWINQGYQITQKAPSKFIEITPVRTKVQSPSKKDFWCPMGAARNELDVVIRPVSMSKSIQQAKLTLGQHRFSYYHGPTNTWFYRWHLNDAFLIEFQLNNGKAIHIDETQPYGLFKLADNTGRIRIVSEGKHLDFKIEHLSMHHAFVPWVAC